MQPDPSFIFISCLIGFCFITTCFCKCLCSSMERQVDDSPEEKENSDLSL